MRGRLHACRCFLGRYNGVALVCELPPRPHCLSLPKVRRVYQERGPGSDDEIRD